MPVTLDFELPSVSNRIDVTSCRKLERKADKRYAKGLVRPTGNYNTPWSKVKLFFPAQEAHPAQTPDMLLIVGKPLLIYQ